MVDAVTDNIDRAVTALERWTDSGASVQGVRSAQSEAERTSIH
jgi:hypothetical protein